jgi:hypothetical protein
MERAEQLKVYARSLGDPIYAIETFLKTFDLTQSGNVPFKLFYKQKEIIKKFKQAKGFTWQDFSSFLNIKDGKLKAYYLLHSMGKTTAKSSILGLLS